MLERFTCYNLDYVCGAIIGEAELVDCILVDEKFNKELRDLDPIVYGRSNHVETYAWKLEKMMNLKDIIIENYIVEDNELINIRPETISLSKNLKELNCINI